MTDSAKKELDAMRVRYRVTYGKKTVRKSSLASWGEAQANAVIEADKIKKPVKLVARAIYASDAALGKQDEQTFMVVPSDWEVIK
jgi:hypothetical protein